jgi:hypothetical protein
LAQGLKPEEWLVMQWQWLPRAPLPLDSALPATAVCDDAAFRAASQDPRLEPVYRFSFAPLAAQTPDLHFYRLVQHFNTPLLTMSRKDAGRSRYAYWQGETPAERIKGGFAYFWFFDDRSDGDLIVLEYDFDGRFTLRSARKTAAALRGYYDAVCRKLNEALPR